MTRSTVKKLIELLKEPKREFRRRRKVAYRQEQTESLAIAGRNLFDDESSSSANSKPKPSSSYKSLSGTTTNDPSYPILPNSPTEDAVKRAIGKEGPKGKSMRSKYSRDDYLYCADHTAKLVREQWVDTVDHDGKWVEREEDQDSKEV
ncbi:hypothetical protein Tco_0233073 [Tanacetum coccineum]